MAARIIVRIELTPNAKSRLNDLTDKAGMTQVAMLSRLVECIVAVCPKPCSA